MVALSAVYEVPRTRAGSTRLNPIVAAQIAAAGREA
jgi:hypothetical protein